MSFEAKKKGQKTQKRNGQTLFPMWIGDTEREKWEQAQLDEGYTSLAKFIRGTMNEHITRTTVQSEQTARNGKLAAQLEEQNKVLDARFQELQKALQKSEEKKVQPLGVEIKPRIIALLKVLKRPAEWQEVVGVLGFPKQPTLDALEALLHQGSITMTKSGEWMLNE